MKARKKPPILQYLCLGIVFAAACLYQARAAAFAFPYYLGLPAVDWPFYPDYVKGQPVLESANSAAQHAGAKDGDILLAVNGQPLTGLSVYGEAMRRARPGDVLTANVRSPGDAAQRNVSIVLQPVLKPTSAFGKITLLLIKFLMPAFCLLLGFWVVAVRPRDPSAWLLFFIMQFFATYYSAGVESWGPGIRDLAQAYRIGMLAIWPLVMMLFGVYFPEPIPGKRSTFWTWALRFVIPALLVNALAGVIVNVGQLENFASIATLAAWVERLSKVSFLLTFAAVGTFFALIAMKRDSAVTPDAKRRLGLLQAGGTISMVPACVLFVVQNITGRQLESIFPEWLVLLALSLMFLFPVTLAYSIVVQRAMDVSVVVRQGLQYALATNGIRLVRLLLTAGVLAGTIMLSRDPGRSGAQKIIAIVVCVALWIWLRKVADLVRAWTDRKFFREAYDTEKILEGLSDEVRTMVETQPLVERVATRLAESLHVRQVAVLLADSGWYRPAFALGYSGTLDAALPETGGTVHQLKRESGPERVYFDDEDSWVNTSALTDDERQKLVALAPQLLLPLTVKEKLLGIISLGEKRSEAPYTGTDLRLLKSVALQTGLALANAQLTSAIAVEVSRREKMSREIEIAREVQERLFPQKMPAVAGLDVCGKCRTALGVGGDYYDFLALPEGKLGVALGDVSGKGIAAALTMASLQASLRADATRAGDDLGGLVARVNQMVFDASTEDRYATFFYAQYDPASRRLVYVNGGHCPPMLFRHASGSVERLDQAGGPVVGLMPDCGYEQAETTLAAGDLLVIYTDGISEAMNRDLEEWGEERLTEAVRACTAMNASETISAIMKAADAFTVGAPQHDDMTLVILRGL
ncbi:MAG TPA: SpoIIE family protein phosphatase [Candidatus Acidoferrales bacterium]